jgi:hypothetical protein
MKHTLEQNASPRLKVRNYRAASVPPSMPAEGFPTPDEAEVSKVMAVVWNLLTLKLRKGNWLVTLSLFV